MIHEIEILSTFRKREGEALTIENRDRVAISLGGARESATARGGGEAQGNGGATGVDVCTMEISEAKLRSRLKEARSALDVGTWSSPERGD